MRVVYLSAPPHGWSMLKELSHMIFFHNQNGGNCEIVYENCSDDKPLWDEIKEYDLGINFLGSHKIPANQINQRIRETKYYDLENMPIMKRWLNFHPAPLPELRGRNVAYHAIMNDTKKFGATLHYMDEEYDTGELIEVQRFPIEIGDTAGDLIRKSHECLKRMFTAYIPVVLSRGVLHSYPQEGGEYFKKEPINDCINMTYWQEKRIRACTVAGRFHASCVIGGRKYKITLEE